MYVVLDTNVLISGIFWTGPPSDILHAWQSNHFELALSSEIFDEYKRVADILAKKYRNYSSVTTGLIVPARVPACGFSFAFIKSQEKTARGQEQPARL